MIKGIHHNVYRCRDSEETRRFYEGFLDLPLAAAMEVGTGRGLHTFYALGDASFLAFFEMPNLPFEFKQQDGFDLHIALEVEEAQLESWLDKARAAGLAPRGITDHGVVRSIYFHDPNGYVIELTARTPAHERLKDSQGAHRNLERWQAFKMTPTNPDKGEIPMTSNSKLPSIAAAITSRVADYDAWSKTFDAFADTRREAGILGHHVNRGADDPGLVNVFLPATDRAQLERFLGSDDMKARMRASGVVGAPSVALLVPQDDEVQRGRALASAFVVHDVEDYEGWKAGFDADRESRQRAGIVGHAVSRSATNPKQVSVYLQAESIESLRAMLGSPELAAKMKNGGVSAPTITFLKETTEQARYTS